MADKESHLLLMSASKAGATMTAQLMLAFLGLADEAKRRSKWIHAYRTETFNNRSSTVSARDAECEICGQPGWRCVRFLRSPLDRVVSSYIHFLRMQNKSAAWVRRPSLPELTRRNCHGCENEASFSEFVAALRKRALSPQRLWSDDHYMAQSPLKPCRNSNLRRNLVAVPTEAMPRALQELPVLSQLRNVTPWQSEHYVTKSTGASTSHDEKDPPYDWAWPRVDAAMHGGRLPPYETFLNPKLCRAIGCLYSEDFRAYVEMCVRLYEGKALGSCASCRRACDFELARFRRCGIATPNSSAADETRDSPKKLPVARACVAEAQAVVHVGPHKTCNL
jgi:hypothetical protein